MRDVGTLAIASTVSNGHFMLPMSYCTLGLKMYENNDNVKGNFYIIFN